MERIHIVGVSPRTGTTLLAECMTACFNIDAFEAHEAPLSSDRKDAAMYLTKKPQDLVLIASRMHEPHFHAICMLRDPRDVVVSKHGVRPRDYWVSLALWRARAAIVRQFAGHPRFIVLRYEDLVSEPDTVQRVLMQRLPFLTCGRDFSRFHEVARPSSKALEALGAVRAMDETRIGNWRNHLPRLAGQIARYGPIDDLLSEFAYEQNNDWLSVLNGVTPAFRESVVPDDADRRYVEAHSRNAT